MVCEADCTRREFAIGKIHETRGTEQRMTRGRSKTSIKATIGTVESQSQMRNKHKSDVLATKNMQTFASLKHIRHAYAVHTIGVISTSSTVNGISPYVRDSPPAFPYHVLRESRITKGHLRIQVFSNGCFCFG